MDQISRSGGRTALVTGAAGGIGQAICAGFIQRGITCLMVDVDQAGLQDAANRLGATAIPYCLNLTDFAAVERLVTGLEARFGLVDILVNNAAITRTGHFESRSVDDILGELNINLLAPIVLTRLMIKLLQKSPDGRIINTVSLGGIMPLPETSIYSAAKFGLRGMMLCLGLDAARLGVKVSSVLPSATETPMLMREAIEGGNSLQFMDPPQQPADVARRVMALLDRPILEGYPRWGESMLVRAALLFPNWLPKLIPLFRKKGEAGHRKYLESLERRGLIARLPDGWRLREPDEHRADQ